MKIKYHVHHQDQLQRSIVAVGNTLWRRIACFFSPYDGTLRPDRPVPAQWQEQTPFGEYHNVLDPELLRILESDFIDCLIESNGLAPVQVNDPRGGTTFWRKGGCAEAIPAQSRALIEALEAEARALSRPSRQPSNT